MVPLAGGPARPRVVLADDSAGLREWLTGVLGTRFEVEPVADGARALARALARPPDLVIADAGLPILDGMALTRALRADRRTAGIPILLLSARADEDLRIAALRAGADDCLAKPFSARELAARAAARVELAARRAQLATEARLALDLLRQSPQPALVTTGPDWTVCLANPASRALVPDPPEAVGRRLAEVLPPAMAHGLGAALRQAAEGVATEPVEFASGTHEDARWWSLSCAPLRDAEGAVRAVAILAQDVTDHARARRQVEARATQALQTAGDAQRAQTALREVQEALSGQLDAMTDLNHFLERLAGASDLDTVLTLALDAALELLQAPMGHVHLYKAATRSLTLAAHKGFRERYLDAYARVPANLGSVYGRAALSRGRLLVPDIRIDAEMALERRSAAVAGARALIATPLIGAAGELVGVLSAHFTEPHVPAEPQLRMLDLYLRHVADRVELLSTRDALRRSEQRAQAALDVARIGTWHWYPRSGEVRADARFRSICGVSADAPLALDDLMRRVHPDERSRLEQHATEALRGNPRSLVQELRMDVLGSWRWVAVRARGVKGRDGQPSLVLGTVQDVHARRHGEEQLREAHRQKDHFLDTLAHELRNPLVAIRAGLETLRQAPDPQRTPRALQIMERQLGHLVHLVDDLTDVSRIGRGKIELRRSRVDLGVTVATAVEAHEPVLRRAGLHVELHPPAARVDLDADPVRLAQMVANLLGNAAKFTPSGGHIRISAQRSGDWAEIRVRDDGIGMTPELVQRAFDLFVQGQDPLHQGTQAGLGLGLAIVRRLAQLHGGTVRAYSAGPGLGSEFVLRLPALAQTERAPEPAARSPRRVVRCNRRVLVVDDNPDVAEGLALMLEAMGCETHVLLHAQEALDKAPQLSPQTIFLDLAMPGLNGYELAERIRAAPWGRKVQLVALTGFSSAQHRERTRAAGFDHHLVKPIGSDDLQKLLRARRVSHRS